MKGSSYFTSSGRSARNVAADQYKEPPSLYPSMEDNSAAAAAPVPDLYPTYDLPPPSQQQAQAPAQYHPQYQQQQPQQPMAASSPYLPVGGGGGGMHNNVQQAAYAQHAAPPTGGPQQQQQYQQQQQQQAPLYSSSNYNMGGPQQQQQQHHQQQPGIVAGEGVVAGGGMEGGRSNGGGAVEAYDMQTNGADPGWKMEGEEKWEGGRPAFVDPAARVNSYGRQGSFSKPPGGEDTGTMVAGPGEGEGEGGVPVTPYQDRWAAFLFIAHLAVIFWMAFDWGLPLLEKDVDARDNANQDGVAAVQNSSLVALVSSGTICTLAAAALSYLCLKYVLKNARNVIQYTLFGSILVQVATAVAAMVAGQIWLFVMGLVFALMSACYYRLVRNRIPFASTNLVVATRAIGNASGPVLVSFLIIFVQICWQFVWTLAMMGALLPQNGFSITQGGETYGEFECDSQFSYEHDSYVCVCAHQGAATEGTTMAWGRCKSSAGPGGLLFLLLVSAFWGSLVLQYIVHCVTSGVVAEWWFTGARQGATWASFKRATTTSFGSICFGALFLSIIRAAHQMLLEMRKSENNACMCVADCLLRIVESIAQYFNRYAFTYVAMYGSSFVESGKDAFTLFKDKGLTALINDQLVANVFMFASFGAAVLVGLVGYGFAKAFGLDGGYSSLLAGLGFVVGLLVCSIVLSIVDSAVATVFVCWAEAKEALQKNDAGLYGEMDKAWSEAMEPPQM